MLSIGQAYDSSGPDLCLYIIILITAFSYDIRQLYDQYDLELFMQSDAPKPNIVVLYLIMINKIVQRKST